MRFRLVNFIDFLGIMKTRDISSSRKMLALVACLALGACGSVAAQIPSNDEPSPREIAQLIDAVRASAAKDEVQARALKAGNLLLRTGRYAEAAQLFGALAEKDATNSIVVYSYALATFNVGRAADAETLAERAFELVNDGTEVDRPQRAADALVLMAVIRAVRGDDAAALKALRDAVAVAPNHFDAQFSLGRLLFGMGDDNGAIKAFRTAIKLQPSHPQALFFLASTEDRSGDADAALVTYRSLIGVHPEMFEGHLGLGALLLKRGGRVNVDEGFKELTRALEINPNLYEARVALGKALVANGHPQEALAHLERAAKIAPENPEPHYQLSLAYRKLGRKEDAAAQAAIVKRIHEARRTPKVAAQSQLD